MLRSSRRSNRRALAVATLAATAVLTAGAQATNTKRARLLRIEDTRRDEPAFLDSLLVDRDPSLRSAAALTVGRLGARPHLGPLRALAVDADTGVAATAMFALGLMRDSASATVAAAALRRGMPVSVEAAWLLGQLGEIGRPYLVAALADSALRPESRMAVLLAAARLRPVPAADVIPWVSSPDSALAWRAAYALARGRSAAGVGALLRVAGSPVSAIREQVARSLARSAAGDSLGARARAALELLRVDPEPRVRVNAVRSLATYGAASRPSVVVALRDSDAGVRLAAAQSLDAVMDSSTTSWADAFDADTAFVVRRAVADGAAKRGIVLDATRGWRTSPEWQRRAAARELEGIGAAGPAIDRLLVVRAEPDGRVRAAAVGALAGLVDSTAVRPRVRAALRAALTDPDFGVRATALGALAPGATMDDLASALDAQRLGQRDRQNDARLAFWQLADSVLARAGNVLPDSVARRLDGLSRPGDPIERIAASHIPRFAVWGDSTASARLLDWYLARVREASQKTRPVARIATNRGTLELALFAADAPLTVYNFTVLANRGYFDGQRFHRVVPNFVVQGGDPRGDGNGGPGYAIRDELNRRRYGRGTLGMALSGPNTGGSQFFVTHSPQPHLDGGYTVFGQLISGGIALDRIVQGDRIVRIRIH